MTATLKLFRQIILAVLILLAAAWATEEIAQQVLRSRAQHLLTDIRSLQVNHSGWADAQRVMSQWARWVTPKGVCTSDACTVQIDLIQTPPQALLGYPDKNARNWLPRIADRLGLRSVAARAGFTVEQGVVTSKWFGEQVSVPVREWKLPTSYIPYLSVSAAETLKLRERAKGLVLMHPNRIARAYPSGLAVDFAPEEDSAEKAALMDFQFACITQLRPCQNEGEILPEGWRLLQEEQHSPPSR